MFGALSVLSPIGYANVPFSDPAPIEHSDNDSSDISAAMSAYEAGNITTAYQLAKSAADQGNTDAYILIGQIALKNGAGLSPQDALPWFSKAAQLRRGEAMRAIGEMYVKGLGIAQDVEKGRNWLQDSYRADDFLAARSLADSYFDIDPQQALNWYEKAASHGDDDSAYIAAIMLAENINVKPNSHRQLALLQQAAEAGHPAGMADYGLLVFQGAGTTQSDTEAATWFRKSAEAGDPEGQFLYAYTLAKGEGVTQSFEDAYYWLLKSGTSDVKAYQKDRDEFRKRLEKNVDPAILAKARGRLGR